MNPKYNFRAVIEDAGDGGAYVTVPFDEIRQKISKSFGDEIEVVLEEDTEPRQVTLPADFQAALETQPEAQAFFAGLSYTHQKEYVRWIREAKRQQTRLSRLSRAVDLLLQGKREH